MTLKCLSWPSQFCWIDKHGRVGFKNESISLRASCHHKLTSVHYNTFPPWPLCPSNPLTHFQKFWLLNSKFQEVRTNTQQSHTSFSHCHSSLPHYSLPRGQPPSSQQRGKYQYSISTCRVWNSLVPSKANSRVLHTFQRNLGKADKRQGKAQQSWGCCKGRMSGSCSHGSWTRGQHLQEAWGKSQLTSGSCVWFWHTGKARPLSGLGQRDKHRDVPAKAANASCH